MAIIAKNKGGGERTLAPVGNHIARCVQMVHIGTSEEEIMGKKKILNKVRLTWELPDELHVFDEEKGEQPFLVSKEYTLSMNEKSNLRKDLESWRGKGFTEKQAEEFDITVLIGIPCMLNVIHKKSKTGNEYVNVSGVSPLPKRVECPEQISESFEFNFDEKFSNFENLPEWIQDKIKNSDEYKEKVKGNDIEAEADTNGDEDDDMPF
jgi:hypothetical protein